MGIPVAKCLELPSMKSAKVVAGHNGLDKLVSSVSVLEYADIANLKSELFAGNELIISAFVNIKDDPEMQCNILRRFHLQGVVAVAIYYVGVFMPKIEDSLIAVANELDLPLIVMPEGRFDYRYGEAISEILESIITNQRKESYFVPTILESLYSLSELNHTMGNLLKILSNRLHCTFVAVNKKNMQEIEAAPWPTSLIINYDELIDHFKENLLNIKDASLSNYYVKNDDHSTSSYFIQIIEASDFYLLVIQDAISANKPFDEYVLQQIEESIRLFTNFSKIPQQVKNADSLVKAILNADNYLMTKLARQMSVNIKEIQSMWLLVEDTTKNQDRLETMRKGINLSAKSFLLERYKSSIVGCKENFTVMFMGKPIFAESELSIAEEFTKTLGDISGDLILLCFPRLDSAFEAKELYLKSRDYWYTLKTIFPLQRVFSQSDLGFAKNCQDILQRGEKTARKTMLPIEALFSYERAEDLVETISVFLLDAGSSVSKTAEIMHLHQSTVKYRLKAIKQRVRCDISKLPDAYELYLASAMRRLFMSL